MRVERSFALKVEEQAVIRGANLAAGANAQHVMRITCMRPFVELPRYSVEYQTGSRRERLELRLPYALPRFLSPVEITPVAFLEHWRRFPEAQGVFRGVLDSELLELAGLRHLLVEGADCGAAKE